MDGQYGGILRHQNLDSVAWGFCPDRLLPITTSVSSGGETDVENEARIPCSGSGPTEPGGVGFDPGVHFVHVAPSAFITPVNLSAMCPRIRDKAFLTAYDVVSLER